MPAYLALIIVIVDWALKTTFPPCLGLSVLCFGKFGSFYLFIVLDVVVFWCFFAVFPFDPFLWRLAVSFLYLDLSVVRARYTTALWCGGYGRAWLEE